MVSAITLFFGLSYSSGGVALFTFAAALWLLTRLGGRSQPWATPAPLPLLALGLTATACLVAHVAIPSVDLDVNPLLESRDGMKPLTAPTDPRFWRFLLGLFDRALVLTSTNPDGAWRGVLVLAFVLLPALGLTSQIFRRDLPWARHRSAIVLVALSTALLAYVLVLSYGRASFGARYFAPSESSPIELAERYAKTRFFFWWITALLPFSVLAWSQLLERFQGERAAAVGSLALALLLLLPTGWRGDAEALQPWRYQALYDRDAAVLSRLIQADAALAAVGLLAMSENQLATDPSDMRRRDRSSRDTGVRHGPPTLAGVGGGVSR